VVDGEPVVVAHCHCVDCQRLSGAGHTTGAMFPSGSVVVHGKVAEYALKPKAGSVVTRTFCPVCGSALFGRNTRMPGFVTISVGTLDDPDGVVPQVVVFRRSRRRWDRFDPELPSFETQPDWTPEDGV
jgi:hypothetical protein